MHTHVRFKNRHANTYRNKCTGACAVHRHRLFPLACQHRNDVQLLNGCAKVQARLKHYQALQRALQYLPPSNVVCNIMIKVHQHLVVEGTAFLI
jgi:hypothetical protein